MRPRATVALFLLVLALAGYYLVVEMPRGGDAPGTLPPLLPLVPDAVDRLTITRADNTLAFERVDTHWEMTHPVDDLADASAVMRLLAAVAVARVQRSIGTPDDLAPYGLDRPVAIAIETAGAAPETLLVGGYTVDRALVYAMRDERGEVLLAPTTVRRYATAAVEDYRNKRVATFDLAVVDSFRVVSTRAAMSWYQSPGGWFTVVEVDTIQGDAVAVEGVLRRLRAQRALGFPGTAADTERDAPRVSVYRAPPAPPQHFYFDPRPASVIVRVEPGARVVEVDTTVMEVFAFDVADLRERRLLHFDPAAVERVELSTPETRLTLVRTSGGWGPPNPAMGNIDAGRVDDALSAAAAVAFDRALSESPPPLGRITSPTFRLAVFDAGGTMLDELRGQYETGDTTAVVTSRSSQLEASLPVETLRALADRFRRIQSR